MSTYTVMQFSSSNSGDGSMPNPPQRMVQPSAEKRCPPCTTVILPQQHKDATTELDSIVVSRKAGKGDEILDAQFEIQAGQISQDLAKALTVSKRIELSYPLVETEVVPPYVVIRVRTLPPKPWPFTVSGLLLWLTTDEDAGCFDRGTTGKGPKALTHIDLQRREEYSEDIARQAIAVFDALQVKIKDIMWCGGFWMITIPDNTDPKTLPYFIAHQVCFYRPQSKDLSLDPSALKLKVPKGVEYDDTLYATTSNALLRPGIMLSSSIRLMTQDGKTEERFMTTTSGILVTDRHGQPFITVATHGFEDDGLVYHPNPAKGSIIGKVVAELPGTDMSIAKLNPGLRYVNETFGTKNKPNGIKINGISEGYPPNLKLFDPMTMDNPFSGSCEGLVFGIGLTIPEEGDMAYVKHVWQVFENGNEPADGSCGSPLVDSDGRVVGLFRFKKNSFGDFWSVSAMELRNFGYEICSEEQQF